MSAAAARSRRRPVRKLKPGPGLTPEAVFADQRRRLREAAIELVADGGYDRATVRALSQQAGVSTRTFYRQFANVADCVAFATEATLLDALAAMKEAPLGTRDREDGLAAAVASLMGYFAGNPQAATVALIEAFDAGRPVLIRLKLVTGTFERLLADLSSPAPDAGAVPRQLVSGMVAGAFQIARATTRAGRGDELPGLAPLLSEWMLSLLLMPGEDASKPFALTQSGAGLRREANPFPESRQLSSSAPDGDDRDRILRATVRLSAADGWSSLTVTRIRRVAGVSRQSFNRHFASVPECFLAAIEWLASSAAAQAQAWASSEPDAEHRAHKLVLALCAQAARNNALAGLVFTGILDAGRDGLLCRDRMLAAAAARMRQYISPAGPADNLALEASVAAAWQIAYSEVAAGRAKRLPALSALLTQLVLAPVRSLEASAANG